MLRCLAATTRISQQRGMQSGSLSVRRFVSSTGPALHPYQQPRSTSLENQVGNTRFFFQQGHTKVCGRNRSPNRLRRYGRRFHKGKTAFKHPFIKHRARRADWRSVIRRRDDRQRKSAGYAAVRLTHRHGRTCFRPSTSFLYSTSLFRPGP